MVPSQFSAFLRDRSGATLIVAGVAMPVLVLAMAVAIEIAGVANYRQRLLAAAELTCRQAMLYQREQAKSFDRNKALEIETMRSMADGNLRMLGLQTEPWPLGIGAIEGKVQIRLEGSAYQLLNGSSLLPRIAPAITIDCDALPTEQAAPSAESEVASQDFETAHTLSVSQTGRFVYLGGWYSEFGVEVAGENTASGSAGSGRFYMRLDSGTNSEIKRILDLGHGDYELAYMYKSQGLIPAYTNRTICGKPADVAWATAEQQTYRTEAWIGKYGEEAVALDVCVFSGAWVERRVQFRASGGTYELAIKAAGRADGLSGLIDNIRLCRTSCP